MEQAKTLVEGIVASTKQLMTMNADSPDATTIVATISKGTEQLLSLGSEPAKPALEFSVVSEQLDKLHNAAVVPAQNYRRIATITGKLRGLVKLAALPQNAGVREQMAAIVAKTAGIFAEVDTVDDLDKPLAAIEKAVEKLYGDQNAPSTYNFEQSGKGHHSKK
jgi:hypothetical protein